MTYLSNVLLQVQEGQMQVRCRRRRRRRPDAGACLAFAELGRRAGEGRGGEQRRIEASGSLLHKSSGL